MPNTMIELTCCFCGKSFEKELRYHKRNQKKGITTHFCSRSCSSKYTQSKNPELMHNLVMGSEADDLSPFRKYWSSIRRRCKNKGLVLSIDILDLKRQWEKQKGLCALSDLPMILPSSSSSHGNTNDPYLASLDRINPNKGYTPDNIQWVCLIGQYCKNIYSTEDVIHFCNAVSKRADGWI